MCAVTTHNETSKTADFAARTIYDINADNIGIARDNHDKSFIGIFSRAYNTV